MDKQEFLQRLKEEDIKLMEEQYLHNLTAESNRELLPTFDEFMDWLDIDLGLPKKLLLTGLLNTENMFITAKMNTRAMLTRRKYNQILSDE